MAEEKNKNKIEDFGQKIGGARKDLWKSRGLQADDLEYMNKAECDKYVKKDNIWPKPDYAKMLNEEGYSRDALYFIKSVRDSIPPKPELGYSSNEDVIREKQEQYINFVSEFKERLLEIKESKDIDKLNINYFINQGHIYTTGQGYSFQYHISDEAKSFMTNKLFKSVQDSSRSIEAEAIRKGFLANEPKAILEDYKTYQIDGVNVRYNAGVNPWDTPRLEVRDGNSTHFHYPRKEELKNPDLYKPGNMVVINLTDIEAVGNADHIQKFMKKIEELVYKMCEKGKEDKDKEPKTTKERKKALSNPALAFVERTGPEVRDRDIVGEDFIKDFGIKGGEFGNWLNEADRQVNMNMAYDSFKDIAKALDIKDEDIAMGGRLNIAFGSRGIKGTAAHYEPLREVINLTKMNGAGSLGHEYFHALDNMIAKTTHMREDYATEKQTYKQTTNMEKAIHELQKVLKYKETVDVETINKKYQPDIDKAQATFDSHKKDTFAKLDSLIPTEGLTKEQVVKKQELYQRLLSEKCVQSGRNLKSAVINDLSAFKKEVTGTPFTKQEKSLLNNWHYFIHEYERRLNNQKGYLEEALNSGEKVRVETDFYKDAKGLDKSFAKADKGYWQSDIEMSARAFACYLKDKLEEKGIKNDYLTGHAEIVAPNGLKTFPSKEERQAINKAFDKVIEAAKELGIIHDRTEPVKEQKVKRNRDFER